jgi:hypothetical protein
MAGRGGSRKGAGRKAKPVKPAAVAKGVANEILSFLALDKTKHPKKCHCLLCRWRRLAEARDERLRFAVEKSLLDRTLGLPAQAIEQKHSGRVTLEGLVCGEKEEE